MIIYIYEPSKNFQKGEEKMRLIRRKKKETMLGGTLTQRRIIERHPGIELKAEEALKKMGRKRLVDEIVHDINVRIKKTNVNLPKVSESIFDSEDNEDKILLIIENVIMTTLIEKVVMEGNVSFEQKVKNLQLTKEDYQIFKDKICDYVWDLMMEQFIGQILFESPFDWG